MGSIAPMLLVAILIVTVIISFIGYASQESGWTGMIGKTDDFEKRTAWDWLQLLIIPAILALGGLWLTAEQERRQQDLVDQRDRIADRIEDQRAQDSMLQSYLDQMSTLLIDKELQSSAPGDPQRLVAGARTITVLRGLDPERKRTVLRFVYEAKLIHKDQGIVDLSGAVLNKASLDEALLENADLSNLHLTTADLTNADLSGADLSGTDLSGAELDGAELDGANLEGAKVEEGQLKACASLAGATLPDGSKFQGT